MIPGFLAGDAGWTGDRRGPWLEEKRGAPGVEWGDGGRGSGLGKKGSRVEWLNGRAGGRACRGDCGQS